MTEHQLRILRYLDQRGTTHRNRLVMDLAAPESKIGRNVFNGSNSAIPLIAGAWLWPLMRKGYAMEDNRRGRHRGYYLTRSGRKYLRANDA